MNISPKRLLLADSKSEILSKRFFIMICDHKIFLSQMSPNFLVSILLTSKIVDEHLNLENILFTQTSQKIHSAKVTRVTFRLWISGEKTHYFNGGMKAVIYACGDHIRRCFTLVKTQRSAKQESHGFNRVECQGLTNNAM